MTPTDAAEAMGIIEELTREKNGYLGIFENVQSVLVEFRSDGPHAHALHGYRQYTGETLLDALRKAKAAKEGEK